MSAAMKAELWIVGERLCETGHPITPTVRLPPLTRVRTRRSAKTPVHVREELLIAHAERVMAVRPAEHVVPVRHVGRVQRCVERGGAGTGDRGRRQPGVEPGVVRAVDLQVGRAELTV